MKIITQRIFWLYALVFVGTAYISGLFIDLTGDSGLYAAITRQMVESGDWFNLQINGKPYDQKPHLFFWLAGAGVSLFGNSNFAFKLFPFLYGLLGIYFTYRLGKTIYSKKTGMLAALFAGSSQITFLYFFDFHMDSILQTSVVLALWQLAEYLKHKKARNFFAGFVGVGLAMFTKGPIGAVIPFFAVLFFLVADKDFKQLFNPKWILGVMLALLIVSPTLIHLYTNFGVEGLKFYFITNNFGRITGEYAGSNSDPFFYVHTLLWAFLPWTVFVVAAIWGEIRGWIKNGRQNNWGYYLLGSTLVLLFVLSIAKGKAPNYFLIAVAPLSVIAGKWFEEKAGGFKVTLVWVHWIVVMLFCLIVLIIGILFTQYYFIPGLIVLITTIATVFLYRTSNSNKLNVILATLIIVSAFNLILNIFVVHEMFKYQAARQVLEVFNKNRVPGDKLYNYHCEDYEMFFYALEPVTHFNRWEEFRASLKLEGTWIYTTKAGYEDILKYVPNLAQVHTIRYRGMNEMKLSFFNPKTRDSKLKQNYLVKIR